MTDTSEQAPPRRPRGRNRPVVKYPLRWAHEYFKAGVLPSPSFPIDCTEGITDLGMQGNGEWGDCVDAGEVHLERTTAAAAGSSFDPQPNDGDGCLGVVRYKAQTGSTTPPGNGSDMASFLLWCVQQRIIKAFAPVDKSKKLLMQSIMQAGFGLLIGVDLTDENETEFNNGQPFNAGPGEQPDPADGHCVLWAFSQSPTGPHKVGTWAAWWDTTDSWIDDTLVNNADGEAFLLVTTEEQLAKFEPELLSDVEALHGTVGQDTPPIAPPPLPGPPPTPTPQSWYAEAAAWFERAEAWAKAHLGLGSTDEEAKP